MTSPGFSSHITHGARWTRARGFGEGGGSLGSGRSTLEPTDVRSSSTETFDPDGDIVSGQLFKFAGTGLPNRARFIARAAAERFRHVTLERSDATARLFIGFLEFNGLKAINDLMGSHASGDALIRGASRFVRSLRPGDDAAHLSGSKFAIRVTARSLTECHYYGEDLREAMFSGVVKQVRATPELFGLRSFRLADGTPQAISDEYAYTYARKYFHGVVMGFAEVTTLQQVDQPTLTTARDEVVDALHRSDSEMQSTKHVIQLIRAWDQVLEEFQKLEGVPGFRLDEPWLRSNVADLDEEFRLRSLLRHRDTLLWAVGARAVGERAPFAPEASPPKPEPWLLSLIPQLGEANREPGSVAESMIMDAAILTMDRERLGFRLLDEVNPAYVSPENRARRDVLVSDANAVRQWYRDAASAQRDDRSALMSQLPPDSLRRWNPQGSFDTRSRP